MPCALPWLLALGCGAIYLGLGPVPEVLVYRQGGTGAWRLLTAHLAHTDPLHLSLNLIGLLLLAAPLSRRMLLVALGGGLIAVDLGLQLLPTGAAYAGLSGLLHALLLPAIVALTPARPGLRMLFILLVVAKVGVELAGGNLSAAVWPPFAPAHAAGVVAGALALLLGRPPSGALSGLPGSGVGHGGPPPPSTDEGGRYVCRDDLPTHASSLPNRTSR